MTGWAGFPGASDKPEVPKARAHALVSGLVQGVCFRYEARMNAERFGVTGWIKNRLDGKVEVLFEGECESVEKMVAWCHRGPSGARVEKMDVKWENPENKWNSFEVR